MYARGTLAAYEATRRECSLFDVSFRRVWYVRGPDRHVVLDMILTCDLERAMKVRPDSSHSAFSGILSGPSLLSTCSSSLSGCAHAKMSANPWAKPPDGLSAPPSLPGSLSSPPVLPPSPPCSSSLSCSFSLPMAFSAVKANLTSPSSLSVALCPRSSGYLTAASA